MADAGGVARAIATISGRTWWFKARATPTSQLTTDVNGVWSFVLGIGSGGGIRWAGDDPEIQNTTQNTVAADQLVVSWTSLFSDDEVFAVINHTQIDVEPDEVIVYTKIDLTFDTANYTN